MAVLSRLRTIVGAYLLASIAAGHVLTLGMLLAALVKMLRDGHWQDAAAYTATGPIWLIMFGTLTSLFVVVYACVPALLVIGLAEAARIHSAAFYGSGGAIAAVASFYFLVVVEDKAFFRPPSISPEWAVERVHVMVALVVVAAGVIGGLVYWLLAGSSAGQGWRPSLPVDG
jgi:hypothetical protein